MITVKIRDYETAVSTPAAKLPFNQIDAFLHRLKIDGVNQVGMDRVYDLDTQWVLDEDAGEFYLEVIVRIDE